MNNEQFRRLLGTNATSSQAGQNGRPSQSSSTPLHALGSRQKSSIPMTPRSVAGTSHALFAAQLAERNAQNSDARPAKKLRTSAPKGSKLGEGYVDRAHTRTDEAEDERAARLRALEESFRKEEIDQETYDRVRLEVAGGDLSSTHLVKGLDLKLLKRVREGEDVFSANGTDSTKGKAEEQEPEEEPEDVDDKFEALERAEVQAVAKEKAQKHGQYATTALPGQKRSRNQILAELKAAREAAKAKEESALGSRFKKIGQRQKPGTRIERDSKGREVMIIVDEDGHEHRKVRQINPKLAREEEKDRAAFVPHKDAEVLGMEVPEFYKQQQEANQDEEEGDGNIFDDAGSDYDPLAGLEDGSESEDSKEDGEVEQSPSAATSVNHDEQSKPAVGSMPPPPKPVAAAAPRNYFQDSKTALTSADTHHGASMADPAVLAALRKAKALNAASKSEEEEKEAERQARLKKMLQDSSRDDADLDMGFGTNRLEDEEDQDDSGKVRLSKWGGEDGGEGGGGGGKAKRKRGPKKKKGDVNSAADVLQAIARRKGVAS